MGLGADRHRQARERRGSQLPAGALGREACAALKAKIAAAEPEMARVHEPQRRAPLSRPRRRLRRAGRAHRPPPVAPAFALPSRGLELGEQHALVASARGQGGQRSGPRRRLKPGRSRTRAAARPRAPQSRAELARGWADLTTTRKKSRLRFHGSRDATRRRAAPAANRKAWVHAAALGKLGL